MSHHVSPTSTTTTLSVNIPALPMQDSNVTANSNSIHNLFHCRCIHRIILFRRDHHVFVFRCVHHIYLVRCIHHLFLFRCLHHLHHSPDVIITSIYSAMFPALFCSLQMQPQPHSLHVHSPPLPCQSCCSFLFTTTSLVANQP